MSCIRKLQRSLADDRKLGVVDTPDSCAAIQRDLGTWEKWEEGCLIKFSKGKGRALQLGRNNPLCQRGQTGWEATLQDLQVPVSSKLHLSNTPLHQRRLTVTGLH